jgi:hypothetical protein
MFFVLTGIYHYMSEEHKLSPFFKRRIDHHKFEKMMRKGIIYMYYESKSLEEFKFKLVKATVENYIHYKYNINIEDLPHNDVDNFIDYMVDTYEPLLKTYYYNERKNSGNINENYSPAGKEIIPNEIVIHKSNPKFRDKIIEQGLKVRAGECYKIYAGYGTKCKPAIFATNSTNKRSWFDSTYDDDVWEIDTTMMPEIKWYKDRHYESSKKHIVTFQDIPKEAIKLIYEGSGKDGGIMESVDKSEDKKLKLLTKMIHQFFDDVSFIVIKKYENKPMIIVYFDNDEAGRQGETYFAEQIQRKIYEYTGIKLIPYWHTIQYNTDADFRLDAIKLKNMDLIPQYENERNDINESEDKKLKLLTKIMDNIIFPEYKNIICGYDVKNDEAFNEPVVNVTFIGGYGTKLWPTTQGIKKMYSDVLNKIWNTIYNYINVPVGVTMETTPKCDEQENIYLRESVDKSEDKKLKFVTKMIHEFFDEVSFIKIKKYENKPLIRVYFDNDEEADNEESYFAEQIQDKIYKYTGIKLIPYWHNIQYNTDADFRLDAIKLKYDNLGNVINESEEKQPKYLNAIKNLIESFKDKDCVCDINVSYDDEDDMYSVYLKFGVEDLNDKFLSNGAHHYVLKLKNDVKDTIKNYLSIDNLYVGSYGTKRCG